MIEKKKKRTVPVILEIASQESIQTKNNTKNIKIEKEIVFLCNTLGVHESQAHVLARRILF